MAPGLPEYEWLVVAGAFTAFIFGFGTGSNDLANAFGTSVGSGTLSLRTATLIAVVFEFLGVLVLGRVSTNTIAGGIAKPDRFNREPEIYAYGMVIDLLVGGVWQIIASTMGLNVASSHSIIGGIIGFALVYGGKDAVNWQVKDTKSFPPYKGVVPIVVSWFFSPIFTGIVAATVYGLSRMFILRRPNGEQLAFLLMPILVFATTFINVFFIFTRGAVKQLSGSSWTNRKAAWIAAVIASGLAVLAAGIGLPLLKRASAKRMAEMEHVADTTAKGIEEGGEDMKVAVAAEQAKPVTLLGKVKAALLHGVDYDIHKSVKEDPFIAQLHARAEKFDPKVEFAFSYLQVFSAICVIMAHGANEAGYIGGPLSAIWNIYKTGSVVKSLRPPVWILLISASGLIVGLTTYGYIVTAAMGVEMAKISATRGFAAELATSMVLLIASQYGLPTSSSQCVTGGIVGVGLMEGLSGVNWVFLLKQFLSWISTLAVVGLAVAALFSQGVYAPSIPQGKMVLEYENIISNITATQIKAFNTTLFQYRAAASAGNLTQLASDRWTALNTTVATTNVKAKALVDPKKRQSVRPKEVAFYLGESLRLMQSNTVFTLGQNTVFPGAAVCNSNTSSSAACPAPTLLQAGLLTAP